jgi:hypothetical protein
MQEQLATATTAPFTQPRDAKGEGKEADEEDAMGRTTAFGAAYRQLHAIDPKIFRQRKPPGNNPHYALNVLFEGEHVEGVGGPYRQFFTDVSRELKACDLFQRSPNAVAGMQENEGMRE